MKTNSKTISSVNNAKENSSSNKQVIAASEKLMFNENKGIVMIRHIELVDRKTGIAYADKYVDEEQYAEYRRMSVGGDFYVRIVEE